MTREGRPWGAGAGAPLYVVELDDGRSWEFYEIGIVRFADALEDVEEWAHALEYLAE
jgi:hypothetical protein